MRLDRKIACNVAVSYTKVAATVLLLCKLVMKIEVKGNTIHDAAEHLAVHIP